MKATTIEIGGRYEVTGLHETEKPGIYEMRYLHSFGGKSYATKANAIRAIIKHGFEYVETDRSNLICGWD